MLKRILFPLFLAIALLPLACQSQKSTADGKHFGETIDAVDAIPFDQLLTQLKGAEQVPAKVVGRVEAVCLKKGCWMNIVSDTPGKPAMFVKFKDYGFFMPMDIAGREVVMRGYAFEETTPVDELKHYAEDEGKTQAEIDAITEPKVELKFMADGVLLLEKK